MEFNIHLFCLGSSCEIVIQQNDTSYSDSFSKSCFLYFWFIVEASFRRFSNPLIVESLCIFGIGFRVCLNLMSNAPCGFLRNSMSCVNKDKSCVTNFLGPHHKSWQKSVHRSCYSIQHFLSEKTQKLWKNWRTPEGYLF